jgi:hypothetical protein
MCGRAEGDLAFRGRLGVSKDMPVGLHHSPETTVSRRVLTSAPEIRPQTEQTRIVCPYHPESSVHPAFR